MLDAGEFAGIGVVEIIKADGVAEDALGEASGLLVVDVFAESEAVAGADKAVFDVVLEIDAGLVVCGESDEPAYAIVLVVDPSVGGVDVTGRFKIPSVWALENPWLMNRLSSVYLLIGQG